jgi:PAS domain S-box-containing protein
MKKILISLSILLFAINSFSKTTESISKVLVIHSYHPSFQWTARIGQGIDAAFEKSFPDADLNIEFLDSKRLFDKAYQEQLRDLFRVKFTNTQFDVIIVSDDDALDFMLDYGQELFPGVPVVFCGINVYHDQRTQGLGEVTGILEIIDFAGTVDLALRFFPQTNEIIIIGDQTRTGKDLARKVMSMASEQFSEINFRLINDKQLPEIKEALSSLEENSVILFLPFTTEITGKTIPLDHVVSSISEMAQAPVFGLWDFMFPHGTLGGKVVSGYQQGFHAGELAIRVLRGEPAGSIPVVSETKSVYYFDHQQLERFGIRARQLPENAVVVNTPQDFFSRHRTTLLVLAALFLLTTLAMVAVSFHQQRVRKAIAGQLNFLMTLMNTLPNPVFYTNAKGRIKACNKAFETLTNWSYGQIITSNIKKIIPEEKQKWFEDQLQATIESGTDRSFEAEIGLPGKARKDVWISLSVFSDGEGKTQGLVGSLTDITEQKQQIQSIRESEERYALVVKATRDGIWDMNLAEKTLFVSPRWKEIFGYHDIETPVTVDDWMHVIHPNDRVRALRMVASLVSREAMAVQAEIRIKHRNQGYIWVYLHCLAIYSPDGALVRVTGSVADIQARKAMELDLKRWEEVFNNTKMGMALGDTQSPILVKVNPAFAQMHGYTVEELTGKPIATVFAPGNRDALIAHAHQKAYKDGHFIFEADHITKDGRIFPVMIDVTAVMDESGRPLYRIVNCQDISERRAHQQKLLEQKEFISNVMDTSPAGILVFDAMGRFLFCNKAATEAIGLPREEMEKLTYDHPKWKTEDYEGRPLTYDQLAVSTVLRTKRPLIGHRQAINVEGNRRRYLLLNAAPVLNQQGEVESVVCAIQDVTRQYLLEQETKRLIKMEQSLNRDLRMREEELRNTLSRALDLKEQVLQSEKSYRNLMDATSDVVYLKDHLHRIQMVNKAFEIFFRTEAKNVSGQTRLDGFAGSLSDQLMALEKKVMEEGNPLSEDVIYQGKNIKVRMFPVLSPGGKTGVGTFLRDITLEKQTEALRENIRIARRSAEIKQQFLANMSHEIRTPMNGILGIIEFLNRTPLNDEQKNYVETLRDSSDTLLGIINDILDFSKIEAGKMVLHPAPVDLFELATGMKNLFAALSVQKNLAFNLNIDPALPRAILADRLRLNQILTNLISNAVKFTQEGSVTLTLKLESLMEDGLKVRFEVSDTGIGISASDQEKLFTAFSQIDNSFTRDKEGTGLGLSISHRLVNLMQGEAGIVSQQGQGATFWFSFPTREVLLEPANDIEQIPAAETPHSLPVHLLLVEDKPVNQKVIQLMLNSLGCQVTMAANGKEALEKVEERRKHSKLNPEKPDFELIFMDIQMPVMDGLQATQILKESYPDIAPIIGLSANVMASETKQFLEAGMDDFLLKPVKTENLKRILEKWRLPV